MGNPMSVNLAHLRAFHAVAREGQFTTAARAMGVTQPTVSSQVKALEARFSVRLLVRGARKVTLTPLGARLFEVTSRLFSLEEEAAELLGASQTPGAGYLRVGSDGPQLLVPVLAAFTGRYPSVEVSLQTGNADDIMTMLSDLRLDVAVVARPGDEARFVSERFRASELVLMVAREHRWATRRSVALDELRHERLVSREPRSGTRQVFDAALESVGVAPRSVIEIEGREAVREAVAANLGVAVVARAELDRDTRLRALRLRGEPLIITEYLVCLRERRRLAAVSAFVSVARELADPA